MKQPHFSFKTLSRALLLALLLNAVVLPQISVKTAFAASPCFAANGSEARYVGWYGDSPANTLNPTINTSANPAPNITATAIAAGSGIVMDAIGESGASIIRMFWINSHTYAAAVANNDYIYSRVTVNSGSNPIRLTSTDVNGVGSFSGGSYSVSLAIIDLATNQSTLVYQDFPIGASGTGLGPTNLAYDMEPGKSYEVRWYVQTGSILFLTRSMDNPVLNFTPLAYCSDLVTTISGPSPALVVGQSSTVQATVTNSGSGSASGPIVTTITKPNNITVGALPAGCTLSGNTITCTAAGPLAPGAMLNYPIPVTPTSTAPVVFSAQTNPLSSEVTASNNGPVSTTAQNPAQFVADLSVTKTTNVTSMTSGVAFSYLLTVVNNGPNDAPNVVLTDQLPAKVTLNSVTPSAGGSCTNTATTIRCTWVSLANGVSATVTINVTP